MIENKHNSNSHETIIDPANPIVIDHNNNSHSQISTDTTNQFEENLKHNSSPVSNLNPEILNVIYNTNNSPIMDIDSP